MQFVNKDTNQKWELEIGKQYIIGRNPDTANILIESESISRKHAIISLITSSKAQIIDQNSANGTFVDGIKIQPNQLIALPKESKIQFAECENVFIVQESIFSLFETKPQFNIVTKNDPSEQESSKKSKKKSKKKHSRSRSSSTKKHKKKSKHKKHKGRSSSSSSSQHHKKKKKKHKKSKKSKKHRKSSSSDNSKSLSSQDLAHKIKEKRKSNFSSQIPASVQQSQEPQQPVQYSYQNRVNTNINNYGNINQPKKLLWGKKPQNDNIEAKAKQWSNMDANSDDKLKFLKLMGVKTKDKEDLIENTIASSLTNQATKRQQYDQTNQALESQYLQSVSRFSNSRGGLGFSANQQQNEQQQQQNYQANNQQFKQQLEQMQKKPDDIFIGQRVSLN